MPVQTIYVDVRATRAGNGQVHFDNCWRKEGDQVGVWRSGPIMLPNGPDHYDMIFELDDRSGRSLEFFQNAADAIYVALNQCPAGPGNGNGQINFQQVDANRKKLRVRDVNRQACTLKYMLRFDGDAVGQCPPYKYDPEIRNGGGGS